MAVRIKACRVYAAQAVERHADLFGVQRLGAVPRPLSENFQNLDDGPSPRFVEMSSFDALEAVQCVSDRLSTKGQETAYGYVGEDFKNCGHCCPSMIGQARRVYILQGSNSSADVFRKQLVTAVCEFVIQHRKHCHNDVTAWFVERA